MLCSQLWSWKQNCSGTLTKQCGTSYCLHCSEEKCKEQDEGGHCLSLMCFPSVHTRYNLWNKWGFLKNNVSSSPANRQIGLILCMHMKPQAKLRFNYNLSSACQDGKNTENPSVTVTWDTGWVIAGDEWKGPGRTTFPGCRKLFL